MFWEESDLNKNSLSWNCQKPQKCILKKQQRKVLSDHVQMWWRVNNHYLFIEVPNSFSLVCDVVSVIISRLEGSGLFLIWKKIVYQRALSYIALFIMKSRGVHMIGWTNRSMDANLFSIIFQFSVAQTPAKPKNGTKPKPTPKPTVPPAQLKCKFYSFFLVAVWDLKRLCQIDLHDIMF